MAAERFRCAVASEARGEPVVGTASRVTSWVLVEQPGAWGRDAVLGSGLDPAVGRALLDRGRESGTRVLLVRRPDRTTEELRRCFLAHTGARSSWLEVVRLDDPAALLDLDWGRLAGAAPPGFGNPHPRPLCLVCTHGRHDACCADFGRPVVRALAEAGVEDVWESSHLGGDRFAANLVSLPDGSYFGRVAPEGAVALVAGLRRGKLQLDGYRGRSCFPPMVQVAERFAREATGVTDVHGLWTRQVGRLDGDRLQVTFGLHGGAGVRVVVGREPGATAPLTCGAATGSTVWSHHLESVVVLDGPPPP